MNEQSMSEYELLKKATVALQREFVELREVDAAPEELAAHEVRLRNHIDHLHAFIERWQKRQG